MGSKKNNKARKIEDFKTSANLQLVKKPRQYQYMPLEDVTAYEVSRLLEFACTALLGGNVDEAYEKLPETARRHVTVIGES